MTWEEIQNIHKTVNKFPDKKPFLVSLYPVAFVENDISNRVIVTLENTQHQRYGIFKIMYRGHTVAEFTLKNTTDWKDGKKISTKSYKFKTEPGFSVTNSGDGGTKIYQFGPSDIFGE